MSEAIDWREQVASRLETFTSSVEWIGGSADLAFADSIRDLAQLAVDRAVRSEREGWLDQVDEAFIAGQESFQ